MSLSILIPASKYKKGVYQGLAQLSDLVDGDEYFFHKQVNGKLALQHGTVFLCMECKTPASVNAVWVTGGEISEEIDAEARLLGELPELGYDDRFKDEDVCDICSSKKDKEESAA